MEQEPKNLSNYLVFYGFAKLTKKIVRKKSLVVQFANFPDGHFNERQQKYIKQKMHIVHQRYQTIEEAEDAKKSNRSWTKWECFVEDKKWKNNIDLVLQNNFYADEKNVTLEERELIKEKLRKQYFAVYNIKEEIKGQQLIIFDYK